jgi:hypothetical protein
MRAHAVTWVQYQASGTGTNANTNSVGGVIGTPQPINFSLTFSLPADQLTYSALIPNQRYDFDGTRPGVISFTSTAYFSGGSMTESGKIGYSNLDSLGGFPTAIANNNGTGSILFTSSDFYSNSFSRLSGSISSFRIVGEGSPFSGLGFMSSPVPEVSTWAMMILGLGAVGGASRCRRRRVALSGTAI